MNNRIKSKVASVFCLVALSIIGGNTPSNAENSAQVTKEGEKLKGLQLQFEGQRFTLGHVGRSQHSVMNEFYLNNEGPKGWSKLLSVYYYPNASDAGQQVKAMVNLLKKGGFEYEVIPVMDKKTAAISFLQTNDNVAEYNIFFFYPTKDGKALIGRQFATRGKAEAKDALLKAVQHKKGAWFQGLMKARFPQFQFPKAQQGSSSSSGFKLHELKFVEELVDDIQKSGKELKVDADFAKKQGAEEPPKVQFSLRLPQLKNVLITGKPKVPETIRLTLATNGRKVMENIRFTGLKMGLAYSQEKRIQQSVALVEKDMVPKFFIGYSDTRVVGRYKTKVGPYDAGVILAQMKAKDGRKFFAKFVAILEEGRESGVVAVLMLDPEVGGNAQERMRNGFAQKVLHSIRFID